MRALRSSGLLFVTAIAALPVAPAPVAHGQGRRSHASDQAPAPTLAALVAWMTEAPRTFEVDVQGEQITNGAGARFAMQGRVRWVADERRGLLHLDQRDFDGFTGTRAPAAFARLYLLPFLDPEFDAGYVATGVADARGAAAGVRAAIASADGVPSGDAAMFEALLTQEGMARIAEDFFSPLAGYDARPLDGSRIVGTSDRTATPLGPVDAPTRLSMQASEHADCPDGARGACVRVGLVGEPDAARIGQAFAQTAPNLPPGVHVARMVLREETTMIVRRSPARIEQLQSHRVVHVFLRHERHREEVEITGQDVTYTLTLAD